MRHSLVLAAALTVATVAAADDVEHKFQSVLPRGQVQRVVIDVPAGTFTVRNGAADRIALSGIASRDYDGASERIWAQKVVDDVSVEVYVNGPEAIVRRRFGRNAASWRAQKFTGIDLRLDLPPGIDLRFTTTAGEVDVRGDFGDVAVDLRAGEARVHVPRAKVREMNASCRVGEVRANVGTEVITKEGILPGRTHYFNPKGKTHVNVHVTAGEVHVVLTQ